ncbi:MAG: VWA domain-containing protein, partial [Candidatus Omnitrophica bacterium]|nr:VWA domain-containing protein [Candidatus Omnitrophota bacterium]
MNILVFACVAAAVIFFGRRIPLPSRRRIGVISLRLAGVCAVLLALRHYAVSRWREQPRHIVYLVDQSASIDPEQTAWIARRLASLEAMRPPQLSRSLVVFGQEAHVVRLPSSPLTDAQALRQLLRTAPLARDATNLESALLAGLAAIPPPGHGRVILLSDGRQTIGNVERVLPHARRFGLQVYPLTVPTTDTTGLTWERLVVPTAVRQGSSVPVKFVLTNGTSRTQAVEITISREGLPLTQRRARIAPGWQIVSASVPASQTGTMRLEVSVASEGEGTSSRPTGRGSSSQQRTAFAEVEGPPRVLLIQEKPTGLPILATALKRRAMDIALATPQELPTEAGQLLDYDAILLFHTPKSSVSELQVAALRHYVEHFGGGVVMVGLGGKLDEEIAHEAPLDALLPVRFEPKGLQEAKRRVCILLLIDRSASMLGPRIAATKRAAVELVRQLQPEDLVGVLAFDTTPYVVVEMQPAKQVTMTLIDKLVHLKSTGGTDFLPALQASRVRLEASGATVKHAILLSDGNAPFDSNAYHQLLSGFAQHHITLSTVAIGSTLVNTDLLAWLAGQGNGTFYQMRNLDELPQLIARDTQKTLGQLPFAEGYVRPVRSPAAEWLDPNIDWPPLKGYLTTTAKPGSMVELT